MHGTRKAQLFLQSENGLPAEPPDAHELAKLFLRSQTEDDFLTADRCKEMDAYALNVLEHAATWATTQLSVLERCPADSMPEFASVMLVIKNRLTLLQALAEFKKQFAFRQAGGYSITMPDLSYLQQHLNSYQYEENPFRDPDQQQPPLYLNTAALRLRFAGRGLVQLATDPDPPLDEVGVSGTHMLHAADVKSSTTCFNRALVLQPDLNPKAIVRKEHGGKMGVNLVEAALVYNTDSSGPQIGFSPLGQMSSVGAVQASGMQNYLAVEGWQELFTLKSQDILQGRPIRMNLLPDLNGQWPYLVGQNHLVWQDGEPIDPFILTINSDQAVAADASANTVPQQEPSIWAGRQIYGDKSILEMSPVQRIASTRGLCGFDSIDNLLSWAVSVMDEEDQLLVQSPLGLKQVSSSSSHHSLPQVPFAIEGKTAVAFSESLSFLIRNSSTTGPWRYSE
jgi:hypothetical protein